MHTLDFYFDCSSPWTYLAFESIAPLIDNPQIRFNWKPILVGGVFNSVNQSVYQNRESPVPAKQHYYAKDLQDWAAYVGIEIGSPPVFPVNSVKVMRGAFVALEHDKIVPYLRSAFQRYWTQLEDISQNDIALDIAAGVGLDKSEFETKINAAQYKDKLRECTDELIERGGFGSPTMFLDGDDMFFGNDRIVLIMNKIKG